MHMWKHVLHSDLHHAVQSDSLHFLLLYLYSTVHWTTVIACTMLSYWSKSTDLRTPDKWIACTDVFMQTRKTMSLFRFVWERLPGMRIYNRLSSALHLVARLRPTSNRTIVPAKVLTQLMRTHVYTRTATVATLFCVLLYVTLCPF